MHPLVVIGAYLIGFCNTQEVPSAIICHCGISNNTFNAPKVSPNSKAETMCKKYRFCRTCQDGSFHCTTCPQGRQGPYCVKGTGINSTDVHVPLTPKARRRIRSPHCPELSPPKPGSMNCWTYEREKECIGKCSPGHSFRKGEEVTLTCWGGKWHPSGDFPECVSAGGQCDLEMIGGGTFNCTYNNDGATCEIHCSGRRWWSHCFPGRPWNPKLPPCVKPKEVAQELSEPEVAEEEEAVEEEEEEDEPPTCNCENGGTCIYSSLTCYCPPNYSGRRCEQYEAPRQIFCGDPGNIANGERTDINRKDISARQTYAEGSSVIYACVHGYRLIGTEMLNCLSTGLWSGKLPSCQKIEMTTSRGSVISDCGISGTMTDSRITGGRPTNPGDWPWQVALFYPRHRRASITELICGGALINYETVLSAAHCVEGKNQTQLMVYFGKYHLELANDGNQVLHRRPMEIIIHPQYRQIGGTLKYDFAIIRFRAVEFSAVIRPVCLPTKESSATYLRPGNQGTIVGWGETESYKDHSEVMMVAHVPFVDRAVCTEAYKRARLNIHLSNDAFCAGHKNGGADSCRGDSGGPITFFEGRRFVIEGIVSFGPITCGTADLYGVYAKVSSVLTWIYEHACKGKEYFEMKQFCN